MKSDESRQAVDLSYKILEKLAELEVPIPIAYASLCVCATTLAKKVGMTKKKFLDDLEKSMENNSFYCD